MVHRHVVWIVFFLGCLFSIGLNWFLDKSVETKLEKAAWVVNQVGKAIQEKKYHELRKYMDDGFFTPKGSNLEEVTGFLMRMREPDRITGIVTWDMEIIRHLPRNKGFITTSKVKVRGNLGQYEETYFRVEIEFRIQPSGQFPVIHTYQVFDPIQHNQVIETGI